MTGLPSPPAEYWTNIPWWGWLVFLLLSLLITVVLGPWMLARSRGAPSALKSREDRLALREAAADAEREEEIARLRADHVTGWNKARGMEVLAHQLWHDLNNATMRGNGLLFLIQRLIEGKASKEGASEAVLAYQALPMPGPMPKLADVQDVTADQHRY